MATAPVPPFDSEPAPDPSSGGRSRLLRFGLLTLLWLGVSAVFAVQISALGLMPWSSATAMALFDWGPWIIFSPLVLWLAHRLPITPKTWRWSLPAHLVASLSVVVLMELGLSALPPRRSMPPPPSAPERAEPGRQPPPRESGDDPMSSAWFRVFGRARIAVPVYWMLVAGAQAFAQYRRGIERERRALRTEAHLVEARLMALQAQLNPHFLFNTLNAVAELVHDKPRAAEEMIVSLGELLRAALAVQQRREVPLREEIALVQNYCAIQKARFSDRLSVHYDLSPASLDCAVPTLVLQPLVENAILHGVTPERVAGAVFIRSRVAGARLHLEVADTGGTADGAPDEAGRPLHFPDGVGLANTRARLAALYEDRHRFSVERATEGGVSIRIEIPLRAIPA